MLHSCKFTSLTKGFCATRTQLPAWSFKLCVIVGALSRLKVLCMEIRQRVKSVLLVLAVRACVCAWLSLSLPLVCFVRQATVQQHWLTALSPPAPTDHWESLDGPLHPSLEAHGCSTHTPHEETRASQLIFWAQILKLHRSGISAARILPSHYGFKTR